MEEKTGLPTNHVLESQPEPSSRVTAQIHPKTNGLVVPETHLIRPESIQFVVDYLDEAAPRLRQQGHDINGLTSYQKRTLFKQLFAQDQRINRPFSEFFHRGEAGIAELRTLLGLPRMIPLGQFISFAENVVADRDEAMRSTYNELFQTGLLSTPLRKKLRTEHQTDPRNIGHLIHHQSPNENRSITEVVSNAIDFSQNDDHVDVATNEHGFSVRDYGKGMSPVDIIERLGIPFVSGARENGKAKIGKFGMGFYTALDHLRADGDTVKVKTAKDGVGYEIDFIYKNGSVFVSLSTQTDVAQGTEVSIKSSSFDQEAVLESLKQDTRYKRGANVLVNGVPINDVSSYEVLDHTEGLQSVALLTRGDISLEKRPSKCTVLINGIRVESCEVWGINLPEEFIVDLPYITTLPESRNQVVVDATVTSSLELLVKQLSASTTDIDKRIMQLNSLAEVVSLFSSRSSGLSLEFRNLQNNLANLAKAMSIDSGRQIVPAVPDVENLSVENPLYVSDKVAGIGLHTIPGFTRLDSFRSHDTVLLIGDFRADAKAPMVRQGSIILFNKSLYERHRNNPGVLNAYMKHALGDRFKEEFIPLEQSFQQKEAKEIPLTRDYGQQIEEYLELILFTPRTTGHEDLIDLLVPEYRHFRESRQYHPQKTVEIRISHEMAMTILDHLSGENTEKLATLLESSEADMEELNLMKRSLFMSDMEKNLGDEDFIAYARSSRLNRVAEILSIFRPEAIKTMLALPPDEIESAFGSALANAIASQSGLHQLRTEFKVDDSKKGLVFANKLIKQFGKRNQNNRWSQPPQDPEARIFMSMVEMATPLVKAYIGYKKAYSEVGQTPIFSEYVHLNFGFDVIPDEEVYLAVRGIAEMVRRVGKPAELLSETIIPLLQHPLVDRKQVFMGLLACVDTPTVLAMDYRPTDINRHVFWPQIAFDGPKRQENLEVLRKRSWGREKSLLEQAPEIERKMRSALPVIAANIKAVTALPSVSTILDNFGTEIDELRYSSGQYRSSTDQKPYLGLFSAQAVVTEIDRFQTLLSQEHLRVIDTALREHFPTDLMTGEKLAQAIVFINRAMGLSHLPVEKFTFALPIMLRKHEIQIYADIGNFLDMLYERREVFQNFCVDSFIDFWEGVNLNTDEFKFNRTKPMTETQMQQLSRAIDIWQTVGNKPKDYQDRFLSESASSPANRWRSYSWYTDTNINLADTPVHIRPYVLYYREGDFADKSTAENENINLPYSVRLSHLNLARRLQVKDYSKAIGHSEKLVETVDAATKEKDTFVAQRELVHAVEHLSATDPYLFLRELIQNSQDAALHDQATGGHQIAVKDYRRNGQYVVEVTDTVGMNEQTVFGSLLLVGESSKGIGDRGRFGIGFLSVLQGSERVEISTSDGQNALNIILKPIADVDGALIDYELSWNKVPSDRKVTTVRKFSNDAQYAMESAFLHDAMIRYGTFIDAKNINVLFRDNQINREKNLLATRTVPGMGRLELLDGGEVALLQGDLYVTQLPEYMIAIIPESIRDLTLDQGLVVNLSTSVELVRTRNDIAHRDTHIPSLNQVLPGMVVESILKKYASGKVDLNVIPYDYFWADGAPASVWKRRINPKIEADARAINEGKGIYNPERYFQKDELIELLTVVECVTIDGKQRSLRDIAVMADEGYKFSDVEKLPERVSNLIKDRQEREKRVAEERHIFTKKKFQEVEFVPNARDVEILGRESDVHLAFLDLVKQLTPPELREKVIHGYYSVPNGNVAHAWLSTGVKAWNLLHLDRIFNTLQKLLQSDPVSSSEANEFWSTIADISTHEDAHILLRLESWTHHHNELFYETQTQLLSNLLRVDLEDVLTDLRRKYKGTRLSTPELLVRLGYIKEDVLDRL